MDLSKLLKCAFLLYIIKNALFLALLIYDIIAWAISLGKPQCNQNYRGFLLGAWISLLVYEIIQLWKMSLIGRMVSKNDYYLLRRGLLKLLYFLEFLVVLFMLAWVIFGHAIAYKSNNDCRFGYQVGNGPTQENTQVTQTNNVVPQYINGVLVNNPTNTNNLRNGNVVNSTTTNTTTYQNTTQAYPRARQAYIATMITIAAAYLLAPLICLQFCLDACSHVKSWEYAGGPGTERREVQQVYLAQPAVVVNQPGQQVFHQQPGDVAGHSLVRNVV